MMWKNKRCLFRVWYGIFNVLRGQNVEFFKILLSGTYSNHWSSKELMCFDPPLSVISVI